MDDRDEDRNKTVAAEAELTEEQLQSVSGGDKANGPPPSNHAYLVYQRKEVFI
jgi:bacteriocin-like protein